MSTAVSTPGHATPTTLHEETVTPLRAWFLHLWAFVLPLITLTFLVTGPYAWWAAPLWAIPIWVLIYFERGAPDDRRQPPANMPSWPFNLQLYLLVALQITNHVMLGVMATRLSFWPLPELIRTLAHLVPLVWLTGITAGYSGIVIAHELVHRRNPIERFMGRLLLMFVTYEHFATEHVYGHHPRIGTREDPATARFNEDLRTFMRRTIPAQFKSAWRLEIKRNGLETIAFWHPRWLKHRGLQGVVGQVALVIAFFALGGPLAGIFFLIQSRVAITLLETVNYIEHWGLTRKGKKVCSVDSWDTANYLTLHTLVGLSRHADHHAQAARPYQRLRHFEETPKMPRGYYGTILLATFRNARYQELATEELRKRGLGPFRDDSVRPQPQSHLHPSRRPTAGAPETASALG